MTGDLYSALPIVLMSSASIIGLLVDVFTPGRTKGMFGWTIFSLLMMMGAAVLTFGAEGTAFSNMLTVGGYATYFDVLFGVGALMSIVAARPMLQRHGYEYKEYYSLTLFAVAGMMLMAHANHLLIAFIGIEIMSISFYVMSGFFRSNTFSVESSLKYFLLGAFATGFLVYGIALIYGSVGSMSYTDMYTVAMESEITLKNLYWVGIGMLLVGLSFKVAAFPFHVWVPDVYTGAPTVVTAFMSTAGKAAAFSVLIPVVAVVLPEIETMERIQMLIAVIAAMSMLYGNIGAISQTNVKRMLAYSSVAHAGYLLMGVAVGTDAGQQAVMYYLTAYMFMQVGAFVVAAIVESKPGEDCTLEDYKGLSKRNPGLAACMAVFMLSLTGIPFLVGFFGKYYIFKAAIEADMIWLTIVGVVASVISVYFYLGLIVKMYFQDREDEVPAALPGGIANLTLIVTVVGVLVLGFFLDYSVLPTITF